MTTTEDDQFRASTPLAPASGTPAAAEDVPARPQRFSSIGELRAALAALLAMPDDTHVYFGDGQLSFNRVVRHGDRVMQIEFNEIYSVTPDPTGG